jgi:hypothetical protein
MRPHHQGAINHLDFHLDQRILYMTHSLSMTPVAQAL